MQHSNAPAASQWGLEDLADALPGKGVSPAAYAGAGGIVGNNHCSVHLNEKRYKIIRI